MFDTQSKASLICIYSFRGRPCERYLMFACRQTAVIDVAYDPNRPTTDDGINLMVKLDTEAQCACVQKTLPHAGPTLESPIIPCRALCKQQVRIIPCCSCCICWWRSCLQQQQRHIKVALHLVSIVCSAQKSYTIYQYRYLPWLSHWPPSSAMNKSQRTNFKSVYN